MYSYRFIKRPTPALLRQLASLYAAQGWWNRGDGPGLARALIRGSHCFLAVFDGKRAVGMGRAISDGVSDAYIQDVAVLREYRGKGLGAGVVRRLKARLKADGIGWIGLIAQDGSGGFYGKLGFRAIGKATPMMRKGDRV